MTPRAPGQVVTFYSYKGGTGRSMLLANVAWILASNGCRVLAIDWDLEAPGLHRYFSPFLTDPEMARTDGLIDFFVDYAVVATAEESGTSDDSQWYLPHAQLWRYAVPLDFKEFQEPGRLDFVGAGRQGPSYSTRVNEFDWSDFYTRFGGGALMDAVRRDLGQRYDYVLIDSRTGVSDTSGICTVQLPDVLVVCFTLNNQSIDGAAGVTRSIRSQRGDSLRILPVPTRIENAEKEKRDRRRDRAFRTFGELLGGATERAQVAYWDDMAVHYEPFYAYEEVLAAFADEPGSERTLLGSSERLTCRIAGEDYRARRISPSRRAEILGRYEGVAPGPLAGEEDADRRRVFISHAAPDARYASRLYDSLAGSLGSHDVAMDARMAPGDDIGRRVSDTIRRADVVLAVIGPHWTPAGQPMLELESAFRVGKRVIPVLVGGARMPRTDQLPMKSATLTQLVPARLTDSDWEFEVDRLRQGVALALAAEDQMRMSELATTDRVRDLRTEARIAWAFRGSTAFVAIAFGIAGLVAGLLSFLLR